MELHYDADCLYLHFQNHDFALDPVSNQTHLFKAALYGGNCPVWEDDSVEFRIKNPGEPGNRIYYGGFNSNAASKYLVLGAADREGLWKNEIKVTAARHRGYWECRISIPWKDIGIKPVPGNWFYMKFTRFRQSGPETTDWPAEDYAMIRLGDAGQPVVQELPVENQHLKLGKIPVCIFASHAAEIGSRWRRAGQEPAGEARHPLKNGRNRLFISRNKGEAGCYQYEFFSGKHGLLYRSSMIDFNNIPQELVIDIESRAPFSITIDGQSWLKNGASGKYSLFLPKEVNQLKLDAPPGAVAKADIYADGLLLGTDWKPGTVRTVLNRVTNIHPRHRDDTWYLARGGSLQVFFNPRRPPEWDLKSVRDLTVLLRLPAGIDLVDADNKMLPENCCPAAVSWYLDGKTYQVSRIQQNAGGSVYKIRRTRPYVLPESRHLGFHESNMGCYLFLRAGQQAEDCRISMNVSMNGQEILELPRHFNVKILPALQGKQPRRFHLTMATTSLLQNSAMIQAHMQTLQQAGINQICCQMEKTAEPEKYGLGMMGMFSMTCYPYLPVHLNMTELFRNHPLARAVKFDGRKMDTPDFAYLNRHPGVRPFLKKEFQALRKRCPGLTALFWDYESPAIPNNIDYTVYPLFSPYAMQIFAGKNGISEPLTPRIIADKYRSQWEKFSCDEVAETIKFIASVAAECGLQTVLYSGYQSRDTKHLYSIDWERIGSGVDYAYCGYGINRRAIQDTRRAVYPRPLCGGILTNNSPRDQDLRHTVAEIMRVAVECQGGILFWYANIWDHLDLAVIAEASRIICRYEDFITSGKRDDNAVKILSGPPASVFVLTYQKRKIAVFVNETDKEQSITAQIDHHGKITRSIRSGQVEVVSF